MSEHSPMPYVKIYVVLLVLLVVSVVGPMFEIQIVTLITAFGIAGVKAFLVAKHFMHLNMEPPWIRQLLIAGVAVMVVLFYGVAPDVMEDEGRLWKKSVDVEWHQTNESYREMHPEAAAEHGTTDDNAGSH